ncbi:MAG: NADP-dependent oxidoreductase [Alphaproteobacteria bacterium]|nr:NADP-dependent oxidoreductase [Alphaproteobacteria bacterium]
MKALQWILRQRPKGAMAPGDLELVEAPLRAPHTGEVRVRTIYLSVDPTNRIWMSDAEQYLPPVEIGDVMRGITLGVVEESNDPVLKEGDLVTGLGGWASHFLAPAGLLARIPAEYDLPLTAYLSVLGGTGVTAYFGLLDIGRPKAGETVVVSAAAGAVGSLVCQIAKLKGCRVIGITGSDEKCRWLTETLGIDAAINHRTEDLDARLGALCPDGIDVDFENVGGPVLEAVLGHLALKARIVLCGLISGYNAEAPEPGPVRLPMILMRRARMEGFIILDYAARFPEARKEMAAWIVDGHLHWRVDVMDGLENAPAALDRLFTGANQGKQLVRVSAEP